MPNLFEERVFGVPWSVLAAIGFAIAVAYAVIDTSRGTSGIAGVVLRWFHPACWLFLALAAICMAKLTPLPASWAGPLAALGGLCYLVFAVLWLTAAKG